MPHHDADSTTRSRRRRPSVPPGLYPHPPLPSSPPPHFPSRQSLLSRPLHSLSPEPSFSLRQKHHRRPPLPPPSHAAAEPLPPVLLGPNRPHRDLPHGAVKLPDPLASAPDRRSGAAVVRRRPCSTPASRLRPPRDQPEPPRGRARLPLAFPPPSPHRRRAPRRDFDRPPPPLIQLRPGASLRFVLSFQGPNYKVPFPFSFVLKKSKFVNSFKNRRKIRKMQTQLL